MRVWIYILLALLLPAQKCFAWGNAGHEIVAYIAYENLDAPTQKRLDALVKLNPCYATWSSEVKTLPAADQSVALFMLAATWPDAIKMIPHQPPYECQPKHKFIQDGLPGPSGHVNPDVPPPIAGASQNIGYDDDNRRHQYWHFVDTPFSTDGTATVAGYKPNALTELVLLSNALKTESDTNLQSYDLVWIEHLVGDVHQPLHDATRFTSGHPEGDAGGNDVLICATPNCSSELHGYWDDLPGPGNNLAAAIAAGKSLNQQAAPTPVAIKAGDFEAWVAAGVELAKQYAYASPVTSDSAGSSPADLNPAYEANAKKVVNAQLFIAGYRLAALLKSCLA